MKSQRLADKFFKRFSPLKIAIMCVGIFFMGFFLSFLIEVDMGTDPFSFMNLMIARKIGHSTLYSLGVLEHPQG